ncbi:unnamed protein product, partial [Didymodactylos carnosus]
KEENLRRETPYWIEELNLRMYDKECLLHDSKLSYRIYEAAQQLINSYMKSKEFHVGFDYLQSSKFENILMHSYDREKHWITLIITEDTIYILDSTQQVLTHSIKSYLQKITNKSLAQVVLIHMDREINDEVNSDLFTIADAFHFALKKTWPPHTYDLANMRLHLKTCLETKRTMAFSAINENIQIQSNQKWCTIQ